MRQVKILGHRRVATLQSSWLEFRSGLLVTIFQVLRDDLGVLERLGLVVATLVWWHVLEWIFQRLLLDVLPVASGYLSLDLTGSDHFYLLLDFYIQDLFVKDDLGVAWFILALVVQVLPGLLHLLEITYPCHVKYFAIVTDSSVLVSQGSQLAIHITFITLRAWTWEPLDTGALFILIVTFIDISTLQSAILQVKWVRPPLLQRLVPVEYAKHIVSIV
mgnify:CR=1 FL=1